MKNLVERTEEYLNDALPNEEYFTNEEKEVAAKILETLKGTYIIRATQVLEFCKKSLQLQRIN